MDATSGKYTFKCSTCNRPLSVAPIYYHAGSVCGRCSKKSLNVDSSSWNRQIVFEKIAQYLNFPCSYEIYGCTATLSWGSVEVHEKDCTFARSFCPLSHKYFKERCSWIDHPNELHRHIREKHRNMLRNPPAFKITSNFESDIAFCEIAGQLFIIILTINKELKTALCYVSGTFLYNDNSSYQCCVTVLSNQSVKPLIIDQRKIQQFSMSSLNNSDDTFIIDVEYQLRYFSVDELLLTFNIRNELEPGVELNTQFLDELECPICFEYMKPPIFICEAGHNVCEECSKKIDSCPLCRGHFLGGRNFALESLAAKLDYPCVNKQFGCGFVAPSQQMKDHQKNCQYFGRKCFMDNCEWRELNALFINHLKDKHPEKLLQLDNIKTYDSSERNQHYFSLYNDEIFILKFGSIDNNLKFSVLYFEREKSNYTYNLKIIGCSSVGMMVMFSNVCSPVPNTSDKLEYPEFEVTIPFSFLKQFLLNIRRIEFELSIESNRIPADLSC